MYVIYVQLFRANQHFNECINVSVRITLKYTTRIRYTDSRQIININFLRIYCAGERRNENGEECV